MRLTLLFLFLFSISCFGQNIDDSKLYRSVEIEQSGKKESADGNESDVSGELRQVSANVRSQLEKLPTEDQQLLLDKYSLKDDESDESE